MSNIIERYLEELAQCDNIEQVQDIVSKQAERIERLEAENRALRSRISEEEST